MQYLTIIPSQDPNIVTMAGGASQAVFPNTKLGIDSLKLWASEYSAYGEKLKSGNAGLYVTQAGSPVELPFEMNLNYVDFPALPGVEKAKKLDQNQLEKAIQIMSQYDDDVLLLADTNNHSREQLIYILSSVAKTLGTVVSSQKQYRNEYPMANQVLITRPLSWNRISQDKAIEIITGAKQSSLDSMLPDDERGDDDRGEYGLGGDWWKNPQEAIRKIAKIITEDPDIFG